MADIYCYKPYFIYVDSLSILHIYLPTASSHLPHIPVYVSISATGAAEEWSYMCKCILLDVCKPVVSWGGVGKGLFFVFLFFICTQPIHQYTHLLHDCVILLCTYICIVQSVVWGALLSGNKIGVFLIEWAWPKFFFVSISCTTPLFFIASNMYAGTCT